MKVICPKCKSEHTAPIMYGYPAPEAWEASERGEIILGGCMVFPHQEDYGCLDCNHRWSLDSLPAKAIKKMRIRVFEQGLYTGFLFLDKNGMPLVAMHWEHRFNSMVGRYNEIYKVQMPNITPHVCRHTYCSNMAKSGMNPKTLQYLMGHSDIAVTLNVYTHVGLEDAEKELQKMQGLENARKEMGLSDKDDKPLKQNMFKVV